MDKPLQGEIALVTGASRGIGAAIADEFRGQAGRRGLQLVVELDPLSVRADADACAVLLRVVADAECA